MSGAASTPPPVLIQGARVLTMGPHAGLRRGISVGDLHAIEHGDVLVIDGGVGAVGTGLEAPPDAHVIEADGRVLMPAFIDAHTHLCWAGDRLNEWDQKRAGATYLELLEAGGGIMSTVRAVRRASVDELAAGVADRLAWVMREGTTAIEIKSGYGLETETELKMLRAIRMAAAGWPGRVVPTACIGHALDPDQPEQVARTMTETLPAVHEAFPGVAIDAYCERGAWSLDDCVRLFEAAAELHHPLRIHADQFNSLGMTPVAVRMNARSVDHLEATRPEDLRCLAESGTFGVMLPCSGFHVDGRYADGRGFLDAGGLLVIATNANPGSAPCLSMPMAIALAVRHLGLSPAEAIGACTVNAAALLGLEDVGRIAPGCRGDLVLLTHRDERDLAYMFGGNHADAVICGGRVVSRASPISGSPSPV